MDGGEKVEIDAENFGSDYKSLIIIPSLQLNSSGAGGTEFPFNYAIEIIGSDPVEGQDLISQLLDKIAELKRQIAALQAEQSNGESSSCGGFYSNLHFGMNYSNDVICLQIFLKNQGADIYPEGFVTGNFGKLTEAAVIRFQEKYASEILAPFEISNGTGFVGEKTRQKINEFVKK